MPISLSEADINGDIRSILNDTAGNIFTNTVLLPYFKIEYGKLPHYIINKGLPQLRTWQTVTSLAGSPLNVSRGVANFESMIEPVRVLDRLSGSTDDYLPVTKCDDDTEFQNYLITQRFPQNRPYAWQWANDILTISGSNSTRQYNIQFYRYPSPYPYALTAGYIIGDLIDFREYLTHRTAALAALMILRDQSRANELGQEADRIGDTIQSRLIKERQDLPARQRRFQSRNKGYLIR